MSAQVHIELSRGEIVLDQAGGGWRVWLDSKTGVGAIVGEGKTRKKAVLNAISLLSEAIERLGQQ